LPFDLGGLASSSTCCDNLFSTPLSLSDIFSIVLVVSSSFVSTFVNCAWQADRFVASAVSCRCLDKGVSELLSEEDPDGGVLRILDLLSEDNQSFL